MSIQPQPEHIADPVCPGCGATVKRTDRFCETCGSALARVPTELAVRYATVPEPPSSRFGTKSKVALAAVAVIATISAVLLLTGQQRSDVDTVTTDASEMHELTGRIMVEDPDLEPGAAGCILPPPNQNLGTGAVIVVLDEEQRPIATGVIESSTVVSDGRCDFSYTIPDLPKTAEYHLVIDDVTLPEISYSLLDRAGWHLNIQLRDVQE